MVNPTPPPPPLAPGSLLGQYRVDRPERPHDGGATTYTGIDQQSGRPVWVQVLHADVADADDRLARAQTLGRLHSPHLPALVAQGKSGTTAYAVTEPLAGRELEQLVAERGPLPTQLAAALAVQVASVLDLLHRADLAHGSLSARTVLVSDGGPDGVEIMASSALLGPAAADDTPPGPDQGSGDRATPADDIHALGGLLVLALTGRPPSTESSDEIAPGQGDFPVSVLPESHPDHARLNPILAGALAKDPAARPTAGELRSALAPLTSRGAPAVSTPPVPPAPPAPPTPAAAAATPAPTAGPTMIPGSTGPLPPPPPPIAPSSPTGPPPPAGPPPNGPPPPPAGADGSRPDRKKLIIAGAVAAVLVVITGTTLAVVFAGGDDVPTAADPRTEPDPEVAPPPSTEASPIEPPSSEPTASEPPTPTAPGTPDTSGPIAGDLDGDGLGDFAVSFISTGMQIYSSTGTSFKDAAPVRRVPIFGLSGDLDNDGELDVLRIRGEAPQLMVSKVGQERLKSPVAIPEAIGYTTTLDLDLALDDVDGDGNLDLVVGSRIDDDRLQLDVALGNGDGTFEASSTWFKDDIIDGGLVIADVDDDGLADMVHFQTGLRDETEAMGTLLKSTGSAFEVFGESFVVDVGGFALSGGLRSGDIDGDGVDEVVAGTGYGPKINVWEWNGSGFDQIPYYDNSDALEDAGPWNQMVISDVNGDGFDDVVQLNRATGNKDRIGVFLSDGVSLTPAPEFDRPLGIDFGLTSYTLVDNERFRQGS